ncbi:hypothetical protein [Gordonia sp. 852002-51296_SCH5728562-b]|uniref:hypothetical protein n=1 Tax=Gordonia sp. 852002-51296_SCH5728562-b TaxID=1834101 RepID=UPI0012E7AC8F|nr:hypothetical protein [Gordonia sp. 852002-51296_SCH5728562-b]
MNDPAEVFDATDPAMLRAFVAGYVAATPLVGKLATLDDIAEKRTARRADALLAACIHYVSAVVAAPDACATMTVAELAAQTLRRVRAEGADEFIEAAVDLLGLS